jgi:NhaP-type Na+/H+ or K+/H+ antiporter
MVIGGMAFTWVTKQFRFIANHGLICSALIIYSGYLSFAICEVFQFSGVVSVLLCGAILSHYLTYNLSKTGQHNSK